MAKKEAEVAPTDHLVESLDEPLNIELEAKVIGGDATLYVLSMSEENDLKDFRRPLGRHDDSLDGQTWSKPLLQLTRPKQIGRFPLNLPTRTRMSLWLAPSQ